MPLASRALPVAAAAARLLGPGAAPARFLMAGLLAVSAACLPAPKKPRVAELVLVASQQVSEFETDYTFDVVVQNPLDSPIEEIVAVATPVEAERSIAIDGESRIEEQIPARTRLTSKDPITIRHIGEKTDPPYTGADLRWEVTYRLSAPPPNRAPLAGAGYGQTVQAGDLVRLDGSTSGDPDGDPISYAWSFTSVPAGSLAELSPPDAMLTSFVPDLPGTYAVQLVVDDGLLASAPASVWITVLPLDPDPPSVTSHYPESGATLVPTNARISAQFSEWIDPATVTASTFTVVGVEGAVAARSIRGSAGVAIFEPASPLRSYGTYRATLAATIADRQGQPLGVAVEWLFSTGGEIDVDPPAIVSVAPATGSTGIVPTRPDVIFVEFDDTIDATSLVGRFTVSQAGGMPIPGRVEWVTGARARFVPQLPAGQSWFGQTWVATVAPGVLDTSGNALTQGASWSFQTLPSHAPPWLSRPGPGTSGETDSYYAGLPIVTRAHWVEDWMGGPGWWEGGVAGAPATFADWLWDLGWSPFAEPRAVVYDAADLAVGRNVRCFFSGTPAAAALPPGLSSDPDWSGSPNAFFGAVQVGCYASNHGAIPGDPDHPDRETALADAVADREVKSISAIFSRYSSPEVARTLVLGESSGRIIGGASSPWWGAPEKHVQRGDVVTVGPASGTIWAGDLRFGRNDANGIVGWACTNPGCPVLNQRLYGAFIYTPRALLPDGTETSGWRLLGTGALTLELLEPGAIDFRINDDGPGNGNGQFDIPYRVERANAVSFMVYVPDGTGAYRLAPTANLDGEGPKPVPQACIACHGGTWDPDTQTVTGASLLPLDPSRLELPSVSGFTRSEQEEPIRRINSMIAWTLGHRPDLATPLREWIDGAYATRVHVAGQTANDAFVPVGWSADATLYRDVAKPYCLSCHQALSAPLDFDSAAEFRALGAAIQNDVCVQRSMPHAGPTFEAFWQSGAVDVLRHSLFGGTACGP